MKRTAVSAKARQGLRQWPPVNTDRSHHLSREATAVYQYVVSNRTAASEAVMSATGLDRAQLLAAVRELRAFRLLQESAGSAREWAPVGPSRAIVELLNEREAELREKQAQMHEIRDQLLSLQPAYLDSLRPGGTPTAVDVLEDDRETLAESVAEHVRRATAEICIARPGPDAGERPDQHPVSPNLLAACPDGVQVRLITDGRERPAGREELAGPDVETRVLCPAPRQLVLVDRRTAVLPADGPDGTSRLLVVRQPDLIAALGAAFELAWQIARRPLPGDPQPELEPLRMEILRHLAAGHKDEVVARRVGLSVRTCRRHIADVMTQLGASSRFQAGVLAGHRLLSTAEMGLDAEAD
jgi:DNA-binding CsgD family transcriptional regulator/sugar-specific transcriptional regulator TrmB